MVTRLRPTAWLLLGVLLLISRPGVAQDTTLLLHELLQRMEVLERELRELRGDIELLQHQQRTGTGEGAAAAVLSRLEALEQHLELSHEDAETDQPPPPVPVSPPDTTLADSLLGPLPERTLGVPLALPPAGAQHAFDQARTALRDGRYANAAEAFRRYLNVYPENTLTPAATYWLGEAYYAQRDFNQAERTLIQFGSRYPDHEHIPDALLRLGMLYIERDDVGRARQVLQRLLADYPNSAAATSGEQQLRQLP